MIRDLKINFEDRLELKICPDEQTCDAVNYLFGIENLVRRARSEKTGCAIAKSANWLPGVSKKIQPDGPESLIRGTFFPQCWNLVFPR